MPPHEHFERNDNYRQRWNKPQAGYAGTGKITIETTLPKGNHALTVCMDHGWLDNHGYASSNYEAGYPELGLPVGQIKHGETITVDVAAGKHTLYFGDDWFAADALHVEVLQNQSVKVLCGLNFTGIKKACYTSGII